MLESQKINSQIKVPKNLKVAIVYSEFNFELVNKLLQKTTKEFESLNIKKPKTYNVPGALEIPLICKKLIKTGNYDVIIALGVVLNGETAHFEHVSRESIHFIAKLSIENNFPIINGILTVYSKEQALKRLNRGKEFARSAIKTVNTLKTI